MNRRSFDDVSKCSNTELQARIKYEWTCKHLYSHITRVHYDFTINVERNQCDHDNIILWRLVNTYFLFSPNLDFSLTQRCTEPFIYDLNT